MSHLHCTYIVKKPSQILELILLLLSQCLKVIAVTFKFYGVIGQGSQMCHTIWHNLRFSLLSLHLVSFYYLLYLSPYFNWTMEGWLKVNISYKWVSSPLFPRLIHDLTYPLTLRRQISKRITVSFRLLSGFIPTAREPY